MGKGVLRSGLIAVRYHNRIDGLVTRVCRWEGMMSKSIRESRVGGQNHMFSGSVPPALA